MRALTGKDTDRLPEEQARGISIDLGYAPLDLPDGRRLSLIDVPGHERFVRNMVAGATGIDLFLLVVDAAEGARPQTHEHLAILRLLGIERGVVAVTKADAVDAETLELALEEARELVPEAEVVAVSAKTGAGLDELRAALGRGGRPSCSEQLSLRPGPSVRRPRLLAARDRDRRDRDALVRDDRRGRRAAGGAGRARRARPQRPGARAAGRAGRGGPARGAGAAGGRAERVAAWRCPDRAWLAAPELPPGRHARRARADRGRRAPARASRNERRPRPRHPRRRATPSSGSRRRSSRRAATGSSCAAGRPSGAAP